LPRNDAYGGEGRVLRLETSVHGIEHNLMKDASAVDRRGAPAVRPDDAVQRRQCVACLDDPGFTSLQVSNHARDRSSEIDGNDASIAVWLPGPVTLSLLLVERDEIAKPVPRRAV
jgi:hypothetical protein